MSMVCDNSNGQRWNMQTPEKGPKLLANFGLVIIPNHTI